MLTVLAHRVVFGLLAAVGVSFAAADVGGGLIGSITGLLLALGSLLGGGAGFLGAYVAWRKSSNGRRRRR